MGLINIFNNIRIKIKFLELKKLKYLELKSI